MASKRFYRKNQTFNWNAFGEHVDDFTLYCNTDSEQWSIVPNGVEYGRLLERLGLVEWVTPNHSSFREMFDAVRELRTHLRNLAKLYVRIGDEGDMHEVDETVVGHVHAVLYFSDYNNLISE